MLNFKFHFFIYYLSPITLFLRFFEGLRDRIGWCFFWTTKAQRTQRKEKKGSIW